MSLPPSVGAASSRQRLVLAALLAVAALAAWALWRYALQGPAPAAIPNYGQQPVPVGIAAARSGPLPRDLHALGTVTPLAQVVLRSQVDGQLQRLHYTEGQAVSRGQLLAEIDPRPYQTALAAAEGELARVEALLGNAEIDLRRYRQLARQEAVAGQQLDTAEAQARSYAAQRQRLAAGVADARRLLAQTRIQAPHDGRIGFRRVDAGNHVRAADANGLATLVQTRPISALFSISETHLDLLRQAQAQAGDAALQVQAWDADERRLIALGTLQALDNQIHAASGTVKLRALFENADEALFPNQFVNIRLALARQEDVLSIPTAAVQYGADGAFVFVIDDDQRATRRDLTLGRANAGRVEVRSGLAAAERVVVEGVDRLHDGRDVLIVETQ
ncbi:MAG: efflux RND transporter periplasmic adaptor subunit [Achromobacter sp.]|jgi:multidrug efflux system membrane fusion protein|uniref:Multidrug resistance protein MdtA n=1 Tax=Achromobacter insuavis TaxID=1287735 RepID=A0A6J5AZ85_9BURK|nr:MULTISPECIES: efflux RND transporter periplasmic adaptor subunit [Achromobacter]MBN9638254.1 efflux RND transporter periplasmic adaptor subunit [Achromobacter sp.]CAB3684900.1 Multidrug resistance protein MdtA [Achromobacter insuavis]CUI99250.1 Acriflavine resistance protein A precursor [Achromobacter sp. 2789STDY5608633]CUJ77850.1 Acriflavine resistance protein A precursor [Achromobacter sp. 2789STDY5608628]